MGRHWDWSKHDNLLRSDLTIPQIHKVTNIPLKCLYRRCKRLGLKKKRHALELPGKGRAVELIKIGMKYKEISRLTGICIPTIRKYAQDIGWKPPVIFKESTRTYNCDYREKAGALREAWMEMEPEAGMVLFGKMSGRGFLIGRGK